MSVELPITVYMEWEEAHKILQTEAARRLGLAGNVQCKSSITIIEDEGKEQIQSIRFAFARAETAEEGR